ncbi:hypothetical protein VKT23_019235 [Stygiomarasmius scandens]|uniref:Uncharacterized protein n=1 Tax=Marasmiellus scandens TaxID=2682957 RepID=A0ABR1ILY3_9AGAR
MSIQRLQGTGTGFFSTARVEHVSIMPGQTFILHGGDGITTHPSVQRTSMPSRLRSASPGPSASRHSAVMSTRQLSVTQGSSASVIPFYRAYAQVPTIQELEANLPHLQAHGRLWYVVTWGWRIGVFPSWELAQHFVSYVSGPVYCECSSLEESLYWWRLSAADSPGPSVVARCPAAPPCPLLEHCPPESASSDFLFPLSSGDWIFPAAYLPIPQQPPPGYDVREQHAESGEPETELEEEGPVHGT